MSATPASPRPPNAALVAKETIFQEATVESGETDIGASEVTTLLDLLDCSEDA